MNSNHFFLSLSYPYIRERSEMVAASKKMGSQPTVAGKAKAAVKA